MSTSFWKDGKKYTICIRCDTTFQTSAGHFCPDDQMLEDAIVTAIVMLTMWLEGSNEAKFLTYLAERGII